MNITTGEPVELRYALNAFGIPTDDLPVTWTGKIKLSYHKQWLKLRTCIENKQDYYLNSASAGSRPVYHPYPNQQELSSSSSGIVECPNSTDVIF